MATKVNVKVRRYTEVEVDVDVPHSQLLETLHSAVEAALSESSTSATEVSEPSTTPES